MSDKALVVVERDRHGRVSGQLARKPNETGNGTIG
jgi:hypothetical protein